MLSERNGQIRICVDAEVERTDVQHLDLGTATGQFQQLIKPYSEPIQDVDVGSVD